MLTIIRNNQKALLTVVTVLICAAFGWFFNRADTSTGRSTTVFTIDGKAMREGAYNSIVNQRWIAEILSLPGYNYVVQQLAPATAQAMAENSQSADINRGYAATIGIIRNEAKRLGIAISDKEVGKALETSPAFTSEGKFDRAKLDAFIAADASNPSNGIMVTLHGQYGQPFEAGPFTLSQRGNNIADLKQVVSDYLLAEKLTNAIGGGVQFPKWLAEQNYNLANQIIVADSISFTSEEMKDKVDVTEEALQAFYDENKDRYLTETQRVVQYVHFVDSELAPAPTPEQQASMKPEELEAVNEARRNSRNKLGARADHLFDLLHAGKSFEEAAAELEQTLVNTPPFGDSNPPEELAASVRVAQAISKLNTTDAPPQVITDGDTFYVLKIKEILQREPKDFALVKDEVKQELIETRATELAREAANAAHEKLAAAKIGEGTTLEELKKSLEIESGKVVSEHKLTPQSAQTSILTTSDQALRYDLIDLPNLAVSDVLTTQEGFTIALVRDRQIERSDEKAMQIESTDFNYRQMFDGIIFQLWWVDRVAAAHIR